MDISKEKETELIIENYIIAKEKTDETWKQVSSEMYAQVQALKKIIQDYSYQQKADALETDQKLCQLLISHLSESKKTIYSITDFCFSLHIAKKLMPLLDMMRDETDIFSDEIKVRRCEWKYISPEFLKKVIKSDLSLARGIEKLSSGLERLYKIIIRESKTQKRTRQGYIPPEFWAEVKETLQSLRQSLRELVILFKEREVICNIHPLTLERTFKKIQEEIREMT